MILICYDASVDAQAAIDRAARLMPCAEAAVLVIWETILETMTRNGSLGMGLGMVGAYSDDDADAAIKQAAVNSASGSVSQAILHHADRPVLVVPSPDVCEQRHHWAEHAHITGAT